VKIGYVMELRDLEYFVAVAEHGHLGRAADSLGLTHPALSKSLARLEGAMQVKLFNRGGKGMELTAEGSLLLSRARELRQSLWNVAREVSDVSRGHAGHIRVGVGAVVNGHEFVSMAFAEMLRDAPRITIKAMVSDADEILAALHSGQLDVVVNILYPTTPPPAGLVFVPLYDEECVPLCAPNHRLAAHTHVSLVELSKERWALSGAVHSESVLSTLRKLREVFRDSGLEPPRIAFESRSLSLRLQLSANSDVLLYTSRAHARRLVTAPLHVLPVKELYWLRPVGVLHRKEPYMSPAVRRFIDILKRITSSRQAEAPVARLREQTPS
jgi:DNA-binding transcriptional LysR family regulator